MKETPPQNLLLKQLRAAGSVGIAYKNTHKLTRDRLIAKNLAEGNGTHLFIIVK